MPVEMPMWLKALDAQSQQQPDTPVQAPARACQTARSRQEVNVGSYAECPEFRVVSRLGVEQSVQVDLPMWLRGLRAQSQQRTDTRVRARACVGRTAASQPPVDVRLTTAEMCRAGRTQRMEPATSMPPRGGARGVAIMGLAGRWSPKPSRASPIEGTPRRVHAALAAVD